jgi:hypothetical protein
VSDNSNLPPVVLVRRSELASIRLRHIASTIDLSLSVPEGAAAAPLADALTGYTEWGTTRRGVELYVCWTWGMLRNSLVVLSPAALSANIQLTDGGKTLPFLLNRAHILGWVESLPWREKVKEAVFPSA